MSKLTPLSLRCLRMGVKRRHLLKGLVSSNQSYSSQAHPANILYSAICVERQPVISSNKSNIERQFSEMLTAIELENSYLADHEVRHKKEQQAARNKQENAEEDTANADSETVTALDLEDKWDAEVKLFHSSSKITAADEETDKKSLERKLNTSLYLLVKQNIAGQDHWVLPQVKWEDGETLRQTAERALVSVCGGIQATVLGNAPCAVAKYDSPTGSDEKGVKLFFYKAWYRAGNVETDKSTASDYVWVTLDEMNDFCHNSYRRDLKKFIIEF